MKDSYCKLSSLLKAKSVDYILDHLKKDFEASEKKQNVIPSHLDEEKNFLELQSRMDNFLLFGETRKNESILNVLLREMPLSLEEKKILEEWQNDAFSSFFDVLEITDDWVLLRDIVSETEYEVHLNIDKSGMEIFPKTLIGSFLFSNLAPVHGIWFFSGIQRIFPPSTERDLFYDFILQQPPETCYRHNPKKLERAFVLQKEHYDIFVSVFGTDEIVVSGRELQTCLERYYKAWFEHVEQTQHSLLKENLPSEMLEADDIGVVMDPREGLHQFLDYGAFLKGFSRKKSTIKHRGLVKRFVWDETIPAFVFRRLRDRNQEAFRRLITEMIFPMKKDFDPIGDLDLLMNTFKPGWQEIYPSVHPINERFKKYYYQQKSIGRNDPCPCDSGIKYKRCCGK